MNYVSWFDIAYEYTPFTHTCIRVRSAHSRSHFSLCRLQFGLSIFQLQRCYPPLRQVIIYLTLNLHRLHCQTHTFFITGQKWSHLFPLEFAPMLRWLAGTPSTWNENTQCEWMETKRDEETRERWMKHIHIEHRVKFTMWPQKPQKYTHKHIWSARNYAALLRWHIELFYVHMAWIGDKLYYIRGIWIFGYV